MLTLHDSAKDRPLAEVLRDAGVAGCGGAGFPTYAKYGAPKPTLIVNAQESEPGYFIDKWLHKTRVQEFHELFEHFFDWGVERIIVGAKLKDREWFQPLEEATGGTMLDSTGRNRHPPADQAHKVLFSYTDDRYAFGKETALLLVVAQHKVPPGELPGDRGFIVNNSQTLHNIHHALTRGTPVTRKYVHVFGETPHHLFLDVPLGTPISLLFERAGTSVSEIEGKGFAVVEGGPGWFHRVDPAHHSVTRRTNSILVIDPAYRDPDGKDVLPGRGKEGYPRREETEMAREPSTLDDMSTVRLFLTDNPDIPSMTPALPSVQVGDKVSAGQRIAEPAAEGFSLPCHASIDGTVTAVTDTFIEIAR